MFNTHVPENHRPAEHDNAKTSVVNILIYNKLFLKCHVGFYTWDVPLYYINFFVREGCYKSSDLLHQCAKSSKAIMSVQNYQMSGYSMSDTWKLIIIWRKRYNWNFISFRPIL